MVERGKRKKKKIEKVKKILNKKKRKRNKRRFLKNKRSDEKILGAFQFAVSAVAVALVGARCNSSFLAVGSVRVLFPFLWVQQVDTQLALDDFSFLLCVLGVGVDVVAVRFHAEDAMFGFGEAHFYLHWDIFEALDDVLQCKVVGDHDSLVIEENLQALVIGYLELLHYLFSKVRNRVFQSEGGSW